MRVFGIELRGFALAIAVSAACGLYGASADEAAAPEIVAKNERSNFAVAAVVAAGASSSAALDAAGGEVKVAAEPAPCQFVPHAQAAEALAVMQNASGKAEDTYGKLMSVPEDGTGNSADLPATNRRVREIIAQHPNDDMVICVAGCGDASRIVYTQPKEVKTIADVAPKALNEAVALVEPLAAAR